MKNALTLICSNCISAIIAITNPCIGQDLPSSLPEIQFHLTANPWQPLNISRDSYLDAVEGMARVAMKFQDSEGAIIDPYLNREHQYSTPYYAIAVGALIDVGRASDMLSSGVMAMDKSLLDLSYGKDSIPDRHGEFYIAALAEAMDLYKGHVPNDVYNKWLRHISTPVDQIWKGWDQSLNNWRTYVMKGEWSRAMHGFVDKDKAIELIEENWHNYTQYERIGRDKWNLYQDWTSDPQSHAVEAVGRGNLTSIALNGYDGPSADELLKAVRRGGLTSMLLLSPSGQCPPNGRTDDHVFNDILYQLIFEALAEDAFDEGDQYLAGQYRRSAMLAFKGIQRWKRDDVPWEGSYYITKNFYDPGDRIGYQPASQWGNYSGAMMFHLAEAYLTRKTSIKEFPAPTEIGGYGIETDARFSTYVANAGGMQVFINLRGASVPKYDLYWTPLGTVRFSKVNWDDRLGPSDGEKTNDTTGDVTVFSRGSGESEDVVYPQTGLSFGPTWLEKGQWTRIADVAKHYRGTVTTEFVHPLLVKFKVTYSYVTGRGGPYFQQEFIVTPDGIMTYLSCRQDIPFGVSVPLLSNDGRAALHTVVSNAIASTGYPREGDTQNFIGLNQDAMLAIEGPTLKSTYGELLPVKFQSEESKVIIFIYPKSEKDPNAMKVKESFKLTKTGFTSDLGSVEGTIYKGRYSAGGYGNSLDLDQDGKKELTLSKQCGFMVQLREGKIVGFEADEDVQVNIGKKEVTAKAFESLEL